MKMSGKKIGGILALVIGIGLIIFSLDAMGKISQAKGAISSGTGLFSNNPAGERVGSELQGRASQYDTLVMSMLIAGIVLAGGGTAILFFASKRRKR